MDRCLDRGLTDLYTVNKIKKTSRSGEGWLVAWSLTCLFSTNTAISETKRQRWRVTLKSGEVSLQEEQTMSHITLYKYNNLNYLQPPLLPLL